MFQGGTQIILGTSFTAKEEDIIGADNDYKALEAALRNKINNIERTHSGYDEYRYRQTERAGKRTRERGKEELPLKQKATVHSVLECETVAAFLYFTSI